MSPLTAALFPPKLLVRRRVVKEILTSNPFPCYKFYFIPPPPDVNNFSHGVYLHATQSASQPWWYNIKSKLLDILLTNPMTVPVFVCTTALLLRKFGWKLSRGKCLAALLVALWSVLPSAPCLCMIMSVVEESEWLDRLTSLSDDFFVSKGLFKGKLTRRKF